MQEAKAVFDLIRSMKSASNIKVGRHFEGFVADRIVHAVTEPTLLGAMERLAKGLDVKIEYIGGNKVAAFMKVASAPVSSAILHWLRRYSRVAAMVAGMKDDADYQEAVSSLVIDPAPQQEGKVAGQPVFDIPIRCRTLAPLAHGADQKAGNATIFRRRDVLTDTGATMSLPFYAGNAVRGQMRDLLADHFLSALGMTPRRDKPPVNIWFFHTIYAGGVLEEQSKVMEAINSSLGKSGSLRTDGLRLFRDMLPALSLLGSALGNKVICGRVNFGDLRPVCREWGNGDIPVAELMAWEYLTRREDYEGRTEEDGHTGMIANTECLREGTALVGGVDIDSHASEIELGALGRGLLMLQERGKLGAENRRGLGKVEMDIDNLPDPGPYDQWLAENRDSVIGYLLDINAINKEASNASSGPDTPGATHF